ncbi:hypothetical protein, partial [Streptomyces sp. NPDC059015]|uniref:hypothetical protein n=1 Tax=Streptomyces sp. NPDC059015 TaxID=3346698 RepID=UPI0036A5FA87
TSAGARAYAQLGEAGVSTGAGADDSGAGLAVVGDPRPGALSRVKAAEAVLSTMRDGSRDTGGRPACRVPPIRSAVAQVPGGRT